LEHRASDPVSVKNLTPIETSTIVKLLRPYVPVGTKKTRRIVFQLVRKFPVIYKTQRFITDINKSLPLFPLLGQMNVIHTHPVSLNPF
jgi:hypothetical protein